MRTGAYPGSFDPPTTAHLAVALAAVEQCGLDRVDLVLSEVALGKVEHHVRLADRFAVLGAIADGDPRLGATVSPHRLLVDIAEGYDVVIMGADKWAQVVDPRWYGGEAARDEAVAALPAVAVAPRPGFDVPRSGIELDVATIHGDVSSSAARTGAHELMAPEAAAFAAATGAWVEPDRYARWLAGRA